MLARICSSPPMRAQTTSTGAAEAVGRTGGGTSGVAPFVAEPRPPPLSWWGADIILHVVSHVRTPALARAHRRACGRTRTPARDGPALRRRAGRGARGRQPRLHQRGRERAREGREPRAREGLGGRARGAVTAGGRRAHA